MTVESATFSPVIRTIYRGSRPVSEGTVFMSVVMHFLNHSMRNRFCLAVRESVLFAHTFDRSYSLKSAIPCGFRYTWQPSFVKDSLASCSRHSTYVLFSDHALTMILNNRDQTEASSKNFSKMLSLSTILAPTWLVIVLSAIDLVIVLPFAISFIYIKDFFDPFFFSTSNIAPRIMKLLAWTTSFIEERLHDFEFT